MSSNYNELAGVTIANCELLHELGRGNNGVVYLAHQKKLNRNIACKIIAPDLRESPDFMDNLFAEAANAAKLSHRNIIQALDVGDAGDLKYFLMEYVDGSSLEHIRANNPEVFSTEYLLDISIQLADALDYAWSEHRMVHGDIKPGNIMITKDDVVKVGDLGLARSSNGVTGDPADIMITPLYAAPEIISQQSFEADPRSDIYSFGVMFYELACGTAPFTGSLEDILQSHLYSEPRPLFEMNPDMDKELAAFIDRLLAKNPDDRPADWKKVRAGLLSIKRRLFPAAVSGGGVKSTRVVRSTSTGTSWSAESKEEKEGIFQKFPWLMPAILIVIIGGALLYMAIEMGLFK